MKDNGTKIHIDPQLKADIKLDAAKLSKQSKTGQVYSMSDIIKCNREAAKRLKRENPEAYDQYINNIFN